MSRTRVAALSAALALGACVSHPVGPARTFGKYEGKATTTAESALSTVETVRLAAEAAAKGKTLGPFLAQLVSEQEDAASGLEGTFDSIQPPNGKAEQLKDELDELLGDVVDHIAQVRIAARRGDVDGVSDAAKDLDEDSQKLNDFLTEHKK